MDLNLRPRDIIFLFLYGWIAIAMGVTGCSITMLLNCLVCAVGGMLMGVALISGWIVMHSGSDDGDNDNDDSDR